MDRNHRYGWTDCLSLSLFPIHWGNLCALNCMRSSGNLYRVATCFGAAISNGNFIIFHWRLRGYAHHGIASISNWTRQLVGHDGYVRDFGRRDQYGRHKTHPELEI